LIGERKPQNAKYYDFEHFINEFARIIDESTTFLIMSHINPDGDAIGTALGLYKILHEMGKSPVLFAEDVVPSIYRFLPGSDKYTFALPETEFDCAILLEIPHYDRCPVGEDFKAKKIINIDHHLDNVLYGDLLWVDEKASSAGEMLFEIFERLKFNIDPDTALNLYVAIVTDTGGFKYPNTTYRTHRVITEMMKKGPLPTEEIHRRIYAEMDINVLKLFGSVIHNVKAYTDEGFAIGFLPKELVKMYHVNESEIQNFPENLHVIRGVHTFIFLRELDEERTKISFRSNRLPVGKIARQFGGGGHLRAAGCTLHYSIKESEAIVEKVIREMIASGETLDDY
jgi:bifunctional oligoribonuclease and PAP phosphatase NrnA